MKNRPRIAPIALLTIGFLFTVAPAANAAAVPTTLNFQGILLDTAGATVPDSSYALSFRIFDAVVGGNLKWSETQTVTTEHGLFNTFLGLINPVPVTAFKGPDRWFELELVANAQPYQPRTKIGSVAYAYRVGTVDEATGGDIRGDVQIHSQLTVGDLNESTGGRIEVTDGTSVNIIADGVTGKLKANTIEIGSPGQTGRLNLYMATDASPFLSATNKSAYGADLNLYDEAGNRTHSLEADIGGSGGFFTIYRSALSTGFTVDGNYGGSGEPKVTVDGSARDAVFDMSTSADASVQLPDSSISSAEMLDEPGLSANRNSIITTLTQGTSTMQDVVTTSLTTPSSGYIVVRARGMVQLTGTTGANYVYLQIDETAGGTPDGAYSTIAGSSSFNAAVFSQYVPAYVDRVYYKNVGGNYTFRLEANANVTNGAGAVTTVDKAVITATFFRTGYGTVSALVPASQASEFADAVPVSVTAGPDPSVPQQQYYRVDLRELEVKVNRARAEARRLERELREATLREQFNSDQPPTPN